MSNLCGHARRDMQIIRQHSCASTATTWGPSSLLIIWSIHVFTVSLLKNCKLVYLLLQYHSPAFCLSLLESPKKQPGCKQCQHLPTNSTVSLWEHVCWWISAILNATAENHFRNHLSKDDNALCTGLFLLPFRHSYETCLLDNFSSAV